MAQGKKRGITGSVLKIIALVSMLIDHLAVVLIEGNYGNKDSFLYRHSWSSETILQVDAVLREMGRLAFPIFCFLLVQGAMYTHDRRKYLRNMVIFALLSEVPFDLAVYNTVWHTAHQNVFFTLALGLLAIDCLDRWQQEKPWLGFGMVVATGAVAWLLHTDYSVYGVFLIVLFWLFRYDFKAASASLQYNLIPSDCL